MLGGMKKLQWIRHYKSVCGRCLVVFFVVECFLVNTVLLYLFVTVGSSINTIARAPGDNIIDKLASNPTFRSLVQSGKDGAFVKLVQHTLERVYVEKFNDSDSQSAVLGKLGVDVSGAGEALFIYRRLHRWLGNDNWTRLVVDIGANDGWMSSNSYNFIQWGWDAILVEPQASQLKLARTNLAGTDWAKVKFLQAVIDDHDGFVNFRFTDDMVSMESHVVQASSTGRTSQVRAFSVKTFASRYNVPKHFGILSIDAETSSSKVLHQWVGLGFRPLYIVYESLHSGEDLDVTQRALNKAGYTYLTMRGWNHIFELSQLPP